MKGTIYYPEQTIRYPAMSLWLFDENRFVFVSLTTLTFRPGFWEVVKQAWIQYLAVLVIFVFIFHYIKLFVFQNQIITTTVTGPKLS